MNPGRNDPCPCGSGQRYKHCCGRAKGADAPAPSGGATPLNLQQIGALVSLLQQDRLAQLEEQALALLGSHAGTGMVWKLLSVAQVRQGKNALQALRRTAELLPHDAEAHSNLGSALLAQGQHAQASAHLQRALELRPDDVGTLIEAADALRALGRPADSIPLYERALELQPASPEAHNNLGNALLELGRPGPAAAQYRRALDGLPEAGDIHCNLGNALRQQGQFPEAAEASRRAIELNPALAMAHNNLGLSLAGLGQRERAAESYRQALALNPAYLEALDNLGSILCDLGDYAQAVAMHRKAVEIDPQRPENHCHLAAALFELRRLNDAADSYRRALALRPRYPSARLGLAAALRAMGQTDEAEASCRALLAVDPDHADALSLLGELQTDRGRLEQGRELFRRVIELDPGHAAAYCSIAAHQRMTREDSAWLAGAQALLKRPLPMRQRIGLCYALGKHFDDTGEYDEAFDYYRQANELTKLHKPPYDREKLERMRLEITRHFDATRLSPNQGASASELPVFIIGMPRSGTSLTEQILASHPQVLGAGELRFWNLAFVRLEKEGLESAAATRLGPALAREYLNQLGALADRAGRPAKADRGGGVSRVIDKMPANFLHAGLIHALLPRARIIHMQRHPLDTCLSVYCQNFFRLGRYANDLDDLAHYYSQYQALADHWRAVLPATTLLEVPYEALIEDQEGWSRRMVEFIGLPWDPRCLEFHQTERIITTASKWQVRQKLHSASIGRWRHYEKHLAPLEPLLRKAR